MLRTLTVIALSVAASSGSAAGQEPWPGARCYSVVVGPWTRTSGTSASQEQPDAPELIILDSTRVGAPLGLGDPPDTVNRVAHGRIRRPESATAAYVDYESDRWFTRWSRPTPDSLAVQFGTGHSLVTFAFRDDGSRLVGRVDWWVDYGASATARATARPTRCPAGPPLVGRLRLAAVEHWAPRLYAEPPMPGVDLELTTEQPVPCGTHIDYTLLVRDTLLAWTVHGLYPRAEPCTEEPQPARTRGPGPLASKRYTVLMGFGADTNRFTLTVTDSSMQLTTERATFVTADERAQIRPRHNLFVVRCWSGSARALCDEVDRWLVGVPGVTRAHARPHRHEVNEGVRAALFRYDSPVTFERIRACMASIAEQVRTTVGVHVWIRTWLNEEIIAASSRDRGPSDPIPQGVTTRGACAG